MTKEGIQYTNKLFSGTKTGILNVAIFKYILYNMKLYCNENTQLN